MAIETAGHDPNYVTTLMGMDLSTGQLPTKVYVDETTHRLLVNAVLIASAAVIGHVVTDTGSVSNASQAGTWTMQPGNTANTTPWLVTPHNGTNAGIFLADNTDAIAPTATVDKPASIGRLTIFQSAGAAWNRLRAIEDATNSTGTGIAAVGNVAQFDDVSPTAITENRFGNLRMSANRVLYGTIRDAGGNERGANVNANNELLVIDQGARPAATALNTYSARITTNTTTTPTASTAYISSIAISTEAVGTTSTIKIQDKSATPLVLVPSNVTTAAGLTVYNFQSPVKMVSGIDIITAGAAAATVDVWIGYYQ